MRKLLTYSILAFTFLLVNSCFKDKGPLSDGISCSGKCYVLTGKLIDSAANAGIQGGELRFYFQDIEGFFFRPKTYIGRTVTDASGNYIFRFDGTRFTKSMGYFYAEAYKETMFGYNRDYPNRVARFDLDTSLYNFPYNQNFLLFRPATLQVRVTSSSAPDSKRYSLNFNYGKTRTGLWLLGSRPIDTTITWKIAGDLRTLVEASATINGVYVKRQDSLIVPANTTRKIELRL